MWFPFAGGMVILDEEGIILLAKGVQFQDIDDLMVVELLVFREAILFCLSHGFLVVRFEGDAQVVIKKILRADARDTRMGAILEEVVQHFANHSGYDL
ncbi:unnamed protein product [Linum trigynum]|uniref:RNase H type-1 domain-containing protein n=1 Tax=Linum trigynum TaxID=586398 RepID=A0AAV2E5H0_9ROSI